MTAVSIGESPAWDLFNENRSTEGDLVIDVGFSKVEDCFLRDDVELGRWEPALRVVELRTCEPLAVRARVHAVCWVEAADLCNVIE